MKTSKSGKFVADSTFYLCFLEDIKNTKELFNLLALFDFLMTPLVSKEVSRSEKYRKIGGLPSIPVHDMNVDAAQLLRPLFTQKQIMKGETEVIILSYHLFQSNSLFKMLLDEHQPREFVRKALNELSSSMIGTVGLIGDCCCKYKYFSRDSSLWLLDEIEHSAFRVDSDILITTRKRIESCKNL